MNPGNWGLVTINKEKPLLKLIQLTTKKFYFILVALLIA